MLYYIGKGRNMLDGGNGKIGEVIDGMYNYFEVACISNDIPIVDKDVFSYRVLNSYRECLKLKDSMETLVRVRVVFHKKGNEPFLWVECSGIRGEDIQMHLFIMPGVNDG